GHTRDDLLTRMIVGYHQMETAGDAVDWWIDRRRGCDDVVDARMRAAHYDRYAVGRVNGERQLAQLERTRFVRDQRDQMNAGGNLRGLVDQLEVGAGPRGSETHHCRRRAVVVALLRG